MNSPHSTPFHKHTQTDRHTDITTYRLNRPRGWFSENVNNNLMSKICRKKKKKKFLRELEIGPHSGSYNLVLIDTNA